VSVKPTEHACGLLVSGLSHMKGSEDQSPGGMQRARLNTCRSRRERVCVCEIYRWLTAITLFSSPADPWFMKV